jgi:hypothetical protein
LSLELVVSPPCHFLFAIIVGGLSLFQLLLWPWSKHDKIYIYIYSKKCILRFDEILD